MSERAWAGYLTRQCYDARNFPFVYLYAWLTKFASFIRFRCCRDDLVKKLGTAMRVSTASLLRKLAMHQLLIPTQLDTDRDRFHLPAPIEQRGEGSLIPGSPAYFLLFIRLGLGSAVAVPLPRPEPPRPDATETHAVTALSHAAASAGRSCAAGRSVPCVAPANRPAGTARPARTTAARFS